MRTEPPWMFQGEMYPIVAGMMLVFAMVAF